MADELTTVEGTTSQPLIGGLKVTVSRNAFGRQIDSRYRSMELSDAAKAADLGADAYFIRAPIVSTVGDGVEVLATMPGDAPTTAIPPPKPTTAAPWHALPGSGAEADTAVRRAFAVFQQGGVIMDVVNGEQARLAEEAGACAVMALERIPADIKRDGGVARSSDPA